MKIRHFLLASVCAAAVLPAAPASADTIIDCTPAWPTGPVRCALSQAEQDLRNDPPVLDCGPTWPTGSTECAAERKVKELLATLP